MAMISSHSPWWRKVGGLRTHINARAGCGCSEQELARVIRDVLKRRKGHVSDVLLLAAAVTGGDCSLCLICLQHKVSVSLY
jgi:hypothetical protein